MTTATEPEDYLPIFLSLTEEGLPYFVEGGQAVNIWANFFAESEPSLADFLPYTSKDCDLWVDPRTFNRIKGGLFSNGKLKTGDSPSDGQLGIFTTNETPRKEIDLMQGVYGIPPDKIPQAFERSLDISGVRVLDPLFLFKGKCHNLVKLDQKQRQDEKHLRMLHLILPEYFRYLLDRAQRNHITQRALIKEVKLFRAFAKDGWLRQALKKLSFDLDNMIPIGEFRNCGLSTVERFTSQTWPDFGSAETGG